MFLYQHMLPIAFALREYCLNYQVTPGHFESQAASHWDNVATLIRSFLILGKLIQVLWNVVMTGPMMN